MKALIFNKISGAFIGITSGGNTNLLDDTYLKFKTLSFSDKTHEWSGDYDTGALVEIESKPVITESQLNKQAENKITSFLPLYKQLNVQADLIDVLINQVQLIAAALNDETLSVPASALLDASEMRDYITQIRENNTRYKEFYKNSVDYEFMSKADEGQLLSDQLEGGLHEIFGAQKAGVNA